MTGRNEICLANAVKSIYNKGEILVFAYYAELSEAGVLLRLADKLCETVKNYKGLSL